jgi:hypothetical protein
MTYYIFLKSLRSLEEFRKNPHVKIPPKSPSTIFQSLAIIKFYSEKNFSFTFGPIGPAASRPIRPLSPASWPIPACMALAYLPKAVSSSSLRSSAMTPSPSVTATRAPPIGFVVSPAPADPGQNFSSPPLPHASDAPELLQPSLITLPT